MADRVGWHPAERHRGYWCNSCLCRELDANLAAQPLHHLISASVTRSCLYVRVIYSVVPYVSYVVLVIRKQDKLLSISRDMR